MRKKLRNGTCGLQEAMISQISLSNENKNTTLQRWTIKLQQPMLDEEIAALNEYIECFINFGNLGAFALKEACYSDVGMTIVKSNLTSQQIEYHVELRYCDMRLLRVLRNTLFAFSEISHPIDEFKVISDDGSHTLDLPFLVDVEQVLAEVFYPPLLQGLTFPINQEDIGDGRRGRRILIEFSTPISDILLNKMITITELWREIAMFGYPISEQDLSEGHSVILNIEGNQFDEVTFEIFIDLFESATEYAFYSFINSIGIGKSSFHTSIVQVTIE